VFPENLIAIQLAGNISRWENLNASIVQDILVFYFFIFIHGQKR
jgi:hypothetical protein